MATFTDFSDILPDPDNKVNAAGVPDSGGNAGPGFFKVRFRSNRQVQKSRTISGRGVAASPSSHNWEFDISYNPITRQEFEPVMAFLEQREGLYPFFVILPEYNRPRNNTFYTYCLTNSVTFSGAHLAGSSTITLTGSGLSGDPSQGDYFHVIDPSDVNHTKAYKIVRVETPDYYQSGLPVSAGTRRIHIVPPLVRDVASGSTLVFINPKFRVQQKGDVLEHELDADGLYQFSLALEEIQP